MIASVSLFLVTLEQSGLSKWLRESESLFGYYFVLTFHTIGLSLVAGPSVAIDLRLLGVAPELPLAPLKRWFRLMWGGLALNLTTGALLVLSYPVKALTNPVFYVKLALIGFAVWTIQLIYTRVFDEASLSESVPATGAQQLAGWSLLLWVAVISASRLLAYTCRYLLSGVPC